MLYELINLNTPLGGQIIKKNNEDGTILWIQLNPENSDYQAYLKWAEENNG